MTVLDDDTLDGDDMVDDDMVDITDATMERPPVEPPDRVLAVAVPSGTRRLVRWAAGLMLALLVGFVLFVPTLSGLQQQRAQTILDKELRSDLLNGVAPVNGPIATGTPVALLEIPAIGVRQVVVEGTTADELAIGPGHLAGSSLPGQPGVSAILGRRLSFGAPFRDLDRVETGDVVAVTTGQGRHEYTVVDSTIRAREDAAAFIGEGDMLLLVSGTSWPSPDERIVVRATLSSPVQPAGAGLRRGPAEISELGLEGDLGAAAPLLGWLQVLAAVSVVGVVVARRVGGRVAWVLAAPPVAASCILVWEHLLLLFPAVA